MDAERTDLPLQNMTPLIEQPPSPEIENILTSPQNPKFQNSKPLL